MDSVVEHGIGVRRCLVLPPNFSMYQQLPSRRHHLRRPSNTTRPATTVVTIAGHPSASAAGARRSSIHQRHPCRANWSSAAIQFNYATPTGPIERPPACTVGELRSSSRTRVCES
ncbi:unnamed protein product [Urochloa humidicola]